MSRLLLVRTAESGRVDIELADEEVADGDSRVFRRDEEVVMTVRIGEHLVVRDVRRHLQQSGHWQAS